MVGEKSLVRNTHLLTAFSVGTAQFPVSQQFLGFTGAKSGPLPQASVKPGKVQGPGSVVSRISLSLSKETTRSEERAWPSSPNSSGTGFLKVPNVLDLAGLLISFTSAQTQECLNTSQVQGWGETWKNGSWRLWITEISLNLGKIRERNLPCQQVVFFTFFVRKKINLVSPELRRVIAMSLSWGLS